jgi:MoxR-like ATPase
VLKWASITATGGHAMPMTLRPLDRALVQAGRVILGKEHALRLALAGVIARGHLLIEDLPGVGKTTMAHAIARVLGLRFQRIQFTSDLLPGDILGVSIYDRNTGAFQFHAGPIFAHVVLADEINRATPKTQSALLEAMEERQVTIEGETRPLPRPFFVVATQNPSDQAGTFPLPDSQLDRFLMRIDLGYPDPESESALLLGEDRRSLLLDLDPALDQHGVIELQDQVDRVHVAEPLVRYVRALLDFSRYSGHFQRGLSPRAGIALRTAAQAWALLEGRDYVVPEDVQTVLAPVVIHRLSASPGVTDPAHRKGAALLLQEVPIP